ncbi:MAG: DUF2190 family protein [Candidatus Gastranaerophilales bacterium]|nr:DUF2190 family protein [Candidatus Gastranaerophilales bacterium]
MTIKSYIAGADIPANRIVKFSDDNKVVIATSPFDNLAGVTDSLDVKAGQTVDVFALGEKDIEFGGTVARGDMLTCDSNGKAVTAKIDFTVLDAISTVTSINSVEVLTEIKARIKDLAKNTIGYSKYNAVSGDISAAILK